MNSDRKVFTPDEKKEFVASLKAAKKERKNNLVADAMTYLVSVGITLGVVGIGPNGSVDYLDAAHQHKKFMVDCRKVMGSPNSLLMSWMKVMKVTTIKERHLAIAVFKILASLLKTGCSDLFSAMTECLKLDQTKQDVQIALGLLKSEWKRLNPELCAQMEHKQRMRLLKQEIKLEYQRRVKREAERLRLQAFNQSRDWVHEAYIEFYNASILGDQWNMQVFYKVWCYRSNIHTGLYGGPVVYIPLGM